MRLVQLRQAEQRSVALLPRGDGATCLLPPLSQRKQFLQGIPPRNTACLIASLTQNGPQSRRQ